MRKSGWARAGLIAIGGLLGTVLGEALKALTSTGPVQTLFLGSLPLGVDPPFVLDVAFMKLTLGVLFQINLLTILGMVLGLYLHKYL